MLSAGLVLAAVSMTFSTPAAIASHPLPLDAKISDPAWDAGAIPVPGGFYDLTTRHAAPYQTSVWMLYDNQNLYVRFRCEQHGTPITATQTTNDVGFGLDDFVGVAIDTSGAGTNAYLFETTPRGIRYEQANESSRCRPTWRAAATIDGSNWSAVLIVPLRDMRIHPGSPQTWRINFIRNVAASGEHYTWAYNGVMADGAVGSGWPEFIYARYWPGWSGIHVTRDMLLAARPHPRAEIYGLDSVGRDRNVFEQANTEFAPQHFRAVGFDMTYPITPTINFVGTLNPDFSNVEIDQQTIAPQEFRRALTEYRPFFSQGANFVNAALSNGVNFVFYSPSVGPFDRGEKVEGTFGLQSFGLLNFRGFDQTTGNTFDDIAYGYKHALTNRTFQYWIDGAIAHHSIFGDDSTNEYGANGRNLRNGFVWGFDRADEHGSWNAFQSGGAIDQAHNTGAFIDVHQRNYEWTLYYQDITPFYNPLDGYTPASDERGLQLYASAAGATPFIKNYTLTLSADRYADRSGAAHQADFDPALTVTFKNGFSLDGLGVQAGELRSYATVNPIVAGTSCGDPSLPRSYFTGYPAYYCGRTDAFNLMAIPFGYGDGTPSPIDASVSFGPFGYGLLGVKDNSQDYVNLFTISTSRPIGRSLSAGLDYEGTRERGITSALSGSQFLRRVSLGALLGPDENFTISLRVINGTGGFALPGTNLAAAYHRRFRNGDELFFNYGTPASPYTLDRFIAKYLFRLGGESGT